MTCLENRLCHPGHGGRARGPAPTVARKPSILLAVAFMATGLLLCGCRSGDGGDAGQDARIEAFSRAELAIERLRKKSPADWPAITARYEAAAPIVEQVDRRWKTAHDEEIRGALASCARGDRPGVNQQVVAKGLQHVAVLAITGELDAMAGGDRASMQAAARRIRAYFEGIRPTFSRRDRDFFGGTPTLEAGADRALERLAAAATGEPAGLIAARRDLDDVIIRCYALSVIYEVSKVEELRDRDRDSCAVKVKEAEVFLRIIEPRLARHAGKVHASLSAMLKSSYDAMSLAEVEGALRRGLPGVKLR